VVVEAVVPLVTGTCMKRRAGPHRANRLDHGESFLSEYDQFDDYLEMVIQFGVCWLLWVWHVAMAMWYYVHE